MTGAAQPRRWDAATATASGHCYTDDLRTMGKIGKYSLKKGWRQSSFLKIVDIFILSQILPAQQQIGQMNEVKWTSCGLEPTSLWFNSCDTLLSLCTRFIRIILHVSNKQFLTDNLIIYSKHQRNLCLSFKFYLFLVTWIIEYWSYLKSFYSLRVYKNNGPTYPMSNVLSVRCFGIPLHLS